MKTASPAVRRSRTEVFSAALSEYVARHAPDEVTEAMDRACVRSALETFDRVLLAAARPEHTVSTRADQVSVAPSELAELLRNFGLPTEARNRQEAARLRATAGNLRLNHERRLVDGRRLELPTSALRTNRGSDRISLSGHDVNGASVRNRSDAGRRVFAPVSAR
jgi:hypothetical protein